MSFTLPAHRAGASGGAARGGWAAQAAAAAAPAAVSASGAHLDLEAQGKAVERRMLEDAKREHRETTAAAQRALRVAEEAQDIGRATLVEVHRQGLQVEKAQQHFDHMEAEVAEASVVLRFMRRWCCVNIVCCCDCFDPHAGEERTRRRRVAEGNAVRRRNAEDLELEFGARLAGVDRAVAAAGDAARGDPARNEAAARSELLAGAADRAAARGGGADGADGGGGGAIGRGLPEADAAELRGETRRQDALLDRLGGAVDTLGLIARELQGEVQAQAPGVDRLADRTAGTQESLRSLTMSARRV